jgi:nicotinamidase-related amidase
MVVLVDVQEKLAAAMHEREAMLDACSRLARGAGVLGLPVVHTEQNPSRLGPTVPDVAQWLSRPAAAKTSFSCCGEAAFMEAFGQSRREQVLLAGIESHVCVYQTALGLLEMGHEVQVVADAVSSRTARNRDVGIARMAAAGAAVTSVEMALFELLRVAEGDAFREILRIVK